MVSPAVIVFVSPDASPTTNPTTSPIATESLGSLCHELAGLRELVLSGSTKALASPTANQDMTPKTSPNPSPYTSMYTKLPKMPCPVA